MKEEIEIVGEVPAGDVPVSIHLDGYPHPQGLREAVRHYLLCKNKDLVKRAHHGGKDIVAYVSSHGKSLLIGVGVAGVVSALGAGAFVLYRHHRRS